MKILDLFCGCGGFSCGFKEAGNSFMGIDMWDVALETYKANIGGEVIQGDISNLDITTIGNVDILIGSPPCQPHSMANRYKDHDPTLIKRYLEIRDFLKPRWWIMEEVIGAIKTGLIPKEFQRFLKASDFGLPHIRRRLFAGNYPEVTKNPFKFDKILTPTSTGYGHFIYDKRGDYPALANLKAVIATPDSRGYARDLDRIKHERHVRPSTISLIKTPIAEMRGYFHGAKDREKWINEKKIELSPEFCARVMGFPNDYVFHGKKTEQYRQIGNAVCPPVARAIWTAIKENKSPFKKQTKLETWFN